MQAGELRWRRDDDVLRGWLVRPEEQGAPALVLVPDVRGLSEHYRDVARRFAAAGFTTLAVDLYSREGTPELPDMEAVGRWIQSLSDRRVLADLESAVAVLARESPRVGITGFCLGGQYAFMAACRVAGLAAAVSWYGMLRSEGPRALKPESPLEMAPRLGCPWLGLYGEDDPLVPAADLAALRAILEREGKTFEILTYPGAGHAFYNDTRPEAYRPAAAADAFGRAVAFLRRHLAMV